MIHRLLLTFPSRFELEFYGYNSDLPRYYIPPRPSGVGNDGLLLKILPYKGQPWLGAFSQGIMGGPNAIATMPNPDRLCIVQQGTGYLITADEPGAWEEIECYPVTDLVAVPDLGLMVFANYWQLIAYGSEGIRWTSENLVHDDLKILSVDDTILVGKGYSGGREHPQFRVDLKTGKPLNS